MSLHPTSAYYRYARRLSVLAIILLVVAYGRLPRAISAADDVKIVELSDSASVTVTATVPGRTGDVPVAKDEIVSSSPSAATATGSSALLADITAADRLRQLSVQRRGADLRRLFVLDSLFNDSVLLDPGVTSLRDLLIVDSMFNDKRFFRGGGDFTTGELFTIDRLLGDGNGLLTSGTTTIEDLLILDQLFN